MDSIIVGVIYTLKNHQSDPWGIHKPVEMEVLDVKENWVKYKFVGTAAENAIPVSMAKKIWKLRGSR